MKYDLAHLDTFSELANGPIQSDEALFLYSLVRTLRPKIIVEFGFFDGNSAINFLRALPENGLLYSFDCDENCVKKAASIKDPRFKFILKRQEDFKPTDINNQSIDMLFIDASHDFNLNLALFEKIQKYLSSCATILVHDTGTWNKELIPESYTPWHEHMKSMEKIDSGANVNQKEFAHQPDERRFLNHLKLKYPEFQQVHIHSLNTPRHGLTVLQKNKFLPLGSNGIPFELKMKIKSIIPWPFLAVVIKMFNFVRQKGVKVNK